MIWREQVTKNTKHARRTRRARADTAVRGAPREGRIGCRFQSAPHPVPGLLESVYENCLAEELINAGVSVEQQLAIPVVYGSRKLEFGFRIDLLVGGAVIVEVKAVEALAPVHTAQVLTYLRFSGRRLGYVMNFNTVLFKDGIRRVVL